MQCSGSDTFDSDWHPKHDIGILWVRIRIFPFPEVNVKIYNTTVKFFRSMYIYLHMYIKYT
jgi:hypothetical protein